MYTGRTFDPAIGLYYYRHRVYHPRLGRFVTRDPIGFEAGDPNLYRYVFNRPVSRRDPTGLADPIDATPGTGWYPPSGPSDGPGKTCDNFPPEEKCEADEEQSECTKEKCLETLNTIQNVAKQVPHYWPPNACQKWVFDFEQKLGTKLWNNACVKDSGVVGFNWFVPWAGHAAYKITLPDGSVWYIDNAGFTSIGDDTHVGTPEDVPFWIW